MEKHNGHNPQNARIKINYGGKKPNVRFSYPVSKKDSQTRGSMMVYVLGIWFLISWVTLGIVDEVYDVFEEGDLTDEELVELSFVDTLVYTFKYGSFNKILAIIFIFIPAALIYFPFKKYWDGLYPEFRALTTKKKYAILKNKNLKFGGVVAYVELPIFNNVVCDFVATKDFSKYLEEFEIEEYKFYYKRRKKGKRKNEMLWYARWYFNKVPKKGHINVIYS